MSASPRSIDTTNLSGQAPGELRQIDKIVEKVALGMVPLGFMLILLGWAGASKTPLMFEQIPYLISGGLLGVGMMVSGGLLYVAGWIARTGQAAAAQPSMDSLAAMLSTPAANGNGTHHAAAAFVRTPSGSMFHMPDCAIVASRDDVVGVSSAEADDFRPCGMCNPLAVA